MGWKLGNTGIGEIYLGSTKIGQAYLGSTLVYQAASPVQSIPGLIEPFAGTVAPTGYLFCDGSAVSRDTYAALFAVIGTTYGAGDGSTTFNLPDLTGRVPLGVSSTHILASTGGSETVTLIEAELPSHTHEVPTHGHANTIAAALPTLTHTITQPAYTYSAPKKANASSAASASISTTTASTNATRSTNAAVANHAASSCTMSGAVTDCQAFNTGTTGSGSAHTNMQAFLSINYIIGTGA